MYPDVSQGHKIYFEEYGNPEGIKILFLHGGPGLGFSDNDKVFFDKAKFHVIFMDQRGCGRSIPKGLLTITLLKIWFLILINYLTIRTLNL